MGWYCCGLCAVLLIMALTFTGCKKDVNHKTAASFEVDKPYEKGPLTVHVRLDKTKITIAQTVTLELETTVKPGYKIKTPDITKVMENFGIVDWNNLGDRLDPNNNIVSTTRYRLEPFLSGTHPIPAFTFEFADANGTNEKKYELTTDPIDVEATSLLGEQREKLAISDIEDIVRMKVSEVMLWTSLAVLAAAGTAAALAIYVIRNKKKTLIRIFRPAHEIAYELLRRLIQEDLIGKGQIKEFYDRIGDILRYYIEDRFKLRAPEMTTEEFLATLKATNALSAADKGLLEEFLTLCDLVKFAKFDPQTEQIQKTFDVVKDFINKTASAEHTVDVTGSAEAGGR